MDDTWRAAAADLRSDADKTALLCLQKATTNYGRLESRSWPQCRGNVGDRPIIPWSDDDLVSVDEAGSAVDH